MPGPGRGRGSTNRYRLAPQTKLAKIRNDEAARSRVAKRTGKVDARATVTDEGKGGFLSGFKRAMEAALPPAKRRKLYLLHATHIKSPSHPKCQTQTSPGAVVAAEFAKFVKWLLPNYNNRQWRIDNGLVMAQALRPLLHTKTHAPGTILIFNLMTTTNNVHGALGSKANDKQIILGATLFRQQQQQQQQPQIHNDHDDAIHKETTATTMPTTTLHTSTTPCSRQGHPPTYQLYARTYLNFDMSSATVVGRWTDATTEPDIFCHILDRLCHQQTTTDEVHVLRDEESFRQANQDGRLNHKCEKALCLFATEPAWMTGKQ